MVIREQVRQFIESLSEGVVIAASDIGVPRQNRSALVKALNQYANDGILRRVSKGRYYKPRKSCFGELPPTEMEVVKEFLEKDGKTIGYITGTRAFAGLALTTQISSTITVGTNVVRRPVTRGATKIDFLFQPNPIRKKDIRLLVILDALRLIKEIPATTPNDAVAQIKSWIKELSQPECDRLLKLAMAYKPYVKAQLGAIFEEIGYPFYDLRESLNPLSRYKLGISSTALSETSRWNIV